MPMVQEIWKKLNANERLASWGSLIVIASWVLGLVGSYGYGGGTGILGLVCALGVLFVYYVKYAPNQSMKLPAPGPTIALGLAAVVGVTAILSLLVVLPAIGVILAFGLGIVGVLSLVAYVAGGIMMLLGTWREYQAQPKASPPATPPAPPPPPAA